jgi:hypothetical protein
MTRELVKERLFAVIQAMLDRRGWISDETFKVICDGEAFEIRMLVRKVWNADDR